MTETIIIPKRKADLHQDLYSTRLVHELDDDDITESSYKSLCSGKTCLNSIILLYYNISWKFVISMCATALFILDSYSFVYHANINRPFYGSLRIGLVLVTAMHQCLLYIYRVSWRKALNIHKPPNMLFIYATTSLVLAHIVLFLIETYYVQIVVISIECFFMIWRTIEFTDLSAKIDTRRTIFFSISRNILIGAVILLSYSSLWMIQCGACSDDTTDELSWNNSTAIGTFRSGFEDGKLGSRQYYFLSLYFILGTMSFNGFGGADMMNSLEQFTLITVSLLSVILVYGLMRNNISAYFYDKYLLVEDFYYKQQLIYMYLQINQLSQPIVDRVKRYCENYLQKKVKYVPPDYFKTLPYALKRRILYDIYYFAIKKCYVFDKFPESLKREIAQKMHTKIYNVGDSIVQEKEPLKKMIFIARGSCSIMSAYDSETPILTLGRGSCIGASNLVLRRTASCEIRAADYCVTYVLEFIEFWRILGGQCRNSENTRNAHSRTMEFVKLALEDTHVRFVTGIGPCTVESLNLPLVVEIYSFSEPIDFSQCYMREKEIKQMNYDSTFLCKRPPILFPNCPFMVAWNYIVLISTFIVVFFYPARLLTTGQAKYLVVKCTIVFVDTLFVLDVILKCFTTLEYRCDYLKTVASIVIVRLQEVSFYCDMVAAIPDVIVTLVMNDSSHYILNNPFMIVLNYNKVAKFIVINKFMETIEHKYPQYSICLHILKYLLYLFLLSLIICCIFIELVCPTLDTCNKESYIYRYFNKLSDDKRFWYMHGLILDMMVAQNSYLLGNERELYLVLITVVISMLLLLYITGSLLADMILRSERKGMFQDKLDDALIFSDINGLSPLFRNDLKVLLAYFWTITRGIPMDEIPELLQSRKFVRSLNSTRYFDLLQALPIFQYMDNKTITLLASECKCYLIPKGVVLLYEGQMIKALYIIERGFVETASKYKIGVWRKISPGESVCSIELLLDKPSYFTYKTTSYVTLIALDKVHVLDALYKCNICHHIRGLIATYNDSLEIERIFKFTDKLDYEQILKNMPKSQDKSWFVFQVNERHPLYTDYINNMKRSIGSKLISYGLMRRTILPEGPFIVNYERFHMISVILQILYVHIMFFYRIHGAGIFYASIIFDIVNVIDLYLRLHMCYYTQDGILVSHPKYTAMNYIKSSFLVDFIAMFPIEKIIEVIYSTSVRHEKLGFFSTFNRLLMLYRYPGLFHKNCDFSKDTKLMRILFFIPIAFILINTATSIYMMAWSNIWTVDSVTHIEFHFPRQYSRAVYDEFHRQHLMCLCNTAFHLINMLAINETEDPDYTVEAILYHYVFTLIGYFFFNFLFATVATAHSRIGRRLMENQAHLRDLKDFMKHESLPSKMQEEISSHFENTWHYSRGISPYTLCKGQVDTLREIWMIRYYNHILRRVPIFESSSINISRLIGEHLEFLYLLKGHTVVDIYDVTNMIYIIYVGEIDVQNQLDNKIEVLSEGSLFGNLDNVEYTRSLVKYVSSTPTRLIQIKTKKFYHLLRTCPLLLKKIEYNLLTQNLSYLRSCTPFDERISFDIDVIIRWSMDVVSPSKQMTIIFAFLTYLSVLYAYFFIAFKTRQNKVYLGVFYAFDFIYVLQVTTKFATIQYIHRHEILRRRYEFKRYMKSLFILDVFCVIPFELCVSSLQLPNLEDFACLNRTFKLWWLYLLIRDKYRSLNANVTLIIILSGFIFTTLYLHCCACILFFVACPDKVCRPESWPMNVLKNVNISSDVEMRRYYVSSLYYATSLFTLTTYLDFQPYSLYDNLAAVSLTLVGRVLFILFIVQLSDIFSQFCFHRSTFHLKRTRMEYFLSHSMISDHLQNLTMKYINTLWVFRRGWQIPRLFQKLPTYLMTGYKLAMYGYHIFNNPVFEKCHEHFISQVIHEMRLEIYFEGDVICEKGDLNDTMYFIHKGKVDVIDDTENERIKIDELEERDCFGIVQGLIPCYPHKFSFIATEGAAILSLKRQHWENKLHFFPASKFTIYQYFNVVK